MEPTTTAALIGGGASLIGGLMQWAGSASSAKDMMKFQERMSRTQHQREVEDLRKAGLNPILSAGGSGASSPAGAMFTPPDISGGITNSALGASRLSQELKNLKANEKNTHQDTFVKHTQSGLNLDAATQTRANTRATNEQTRLTRIEQEIRKTVLKQEQAILDGLQIEQRIDNSRAGEISRLLKRFLPLGNSAGSLLRRK